MSWQDELYQKTFQEELVGLERRLEYDANCGASDLEGILKQLYIMDGSDWLGRGESASTVLDAQIAAYELTISRLRPSKNEEPPAQVR
jgi:hypothetical protein